MTIPLLEVSFDGMFEYGQGYVALSRAVSLDGLTLRSFSPHAVKAHQTVKVFYESIRERMTDAATNAAVETTVAALVEQFEKYHARDGGDGTVSDASAAAAGGGEDDEGWIDNAPRKALRAAVAAFHSKKIADGISTANANKLPEEADEWLELDGSIIKNEHHQPGSAVAPTMPASAAASVRGCGNIMSPIVKNASAETAGSASSIVNRTQSESTAASAASAVQQPVQLTDEIKLLVSEADCNRLKETSSIAFS